MKSCILFFRLTDKCFKHGEFPKTLYSNQSIIKIKDDAAQDYVLDSFIAGIEEKLRSIISAQDNKISLSGRS